MTKEERVKMLTRVLSIVMIEPDIEKFIKALDNRGSSLLPPHRGITGHMREDFSTIPTR